MHDLTSRLDSATGRNAAIRLALYGDSAAPALQRIAHAPSWRARYWGVAALGMIDTAKGRAAITTFLDDADWRVRISAILALRMSSDNYHKDVEMDVHTGESPKTAAMLKAYDAADALPAARRILHDAMPSDDRVTWLLRWFSTGYVRCGTSANGLLIALHRRSDLEGPLDPSMHLYWTVRGSLHEQKLDLPLAWNPGVPTAYYFEPWTSSPSDRVRTWHTPTGVVIEIMLDDPHSGTWERRAPAFYQRVGAHWKLLNRHIAPFQFSNYGGCHVSSDHARLYVWDIDADLATSTRSGPRKFWLRTFVFRNGEFRKLRTRFTRRNYTFDSNPPKGIPLAPNKDPLREFGMHWTWWQEE